MNSKLIELNLRAQESLATVGNYEKELHFKYYSICFWII